MKTQKRTHKVEDLEQFFKEVATLTLRHREIENMAWVSPADLGNALMKVDPEWWKLVGNK
jgi:predicted transcriptional regulator